MLARIGHLAIGKLQDINDVVRLTISSAIALPSLFFKPCQPVFSTFQKQIYFSGIETLKVIIPISMAIGAIITAQIISLIGVGNESLIAKVLIWSVLRELGPLLTILIVIARSGAAIATELGTMQINREIETIESMGIPHLHYLVLPRIAGVMISVVVLTLYFEAGAISGGILCGAIGWHIPFEQFSQGLYSALSLKEIFLSVTKSVFFGLTVSAVCCSKGLQVAGSATMVPQAATKGVMFSLFSVFIIDGFITIITR